MLNAARHSGSKRKVCKSGLNVSDFICGFNLVQFSPFVLLEGFLLDGLFVCLFVCLFVFCIV